MKKALIITIAILAIAAGAAAYLLLTDRTDNSEPRRIYLPQGTTFDTLCDSIDATTSFRIIARGLKLDQNVRPGSYIVEAHTSQLALVRKLRNGQQDPIRLTIGKFRTPEQLNAYLNQKLMHNDFNVTLDNFHLILTDTYEFYWTITPEQFMQRMEKESNKYWNEECGMRNEELNEESADAVKNSSLFTFHSSLKEIVILASIVEEETNYGPEKAKIANVYWNRLDRGMPLQADPTVKYAVGDFTLKRILNKHLATESPFNTYLHTGLPPAPICLPSKATIRAVIEGKKLKTNYLYFCASDKMDGTHRFAATLAEHNRNAAAFHKALSARGIR